VTSPPPEGADLLRTGDYARKQIFCRSSVVRWSHGSRFDLARQLVAGRGERLLDYGCGDGTFVAMAHDRFRDVLGADVDAAQVQECARRLGALTNVRFGLTADLDAAHAHAWNVVSCMEVLEHCLEEERRRVLGDLARLVAPDGTVVISVPIEIGPSLLGKQFFRALAGWRGLGDYQYRERYALGDLLRAAAGGRVHRPSYEGIGPNGPYRYYGHRGFDYRDLQMEVAERFRIEKRLFTPISWLGPALNSQAWFVCRPLGS
jgi:SAM-dependent methyltransferase